MKKFGKRIAVVLCLLLFACMALGSGTSSEESGTETADSAAAAETQTTDTEAGTAAEDREQVPAEEETAAEAETEAEAAPQQPDCTEALNELQNGDYHFITNADLTTYYPNLAGMKFYTVASVSEVSEDEIQCTISDGYMMSNFYTLQNYSESLTDDERIAILGTVSDASNSYGFLGTSYSFENCMVFAYGEDAEQYNSAASDEYFAPYFVINESVADNIGDDSLSEEDFKALCQTYDYTDILRNPDSYQDQYCVLSGTVSQVIEGWFDTYSIYINDDNGNKWDCTYTYAEGEAHVLEGDYITVYGKLDGTDTSTTLLGEQVIMPDIEIKYIG